MSTTQKLVYNSFLIALSILATRLFSFMIPLGGIGALRLGFGPVPIILSGVLFGPLWGGLAGLAGDLLGFALNPMGSAFLPQVTVVAVLTGVIPGFLLRNKRKPSFGDFLMAVGISQVVLRILVMPWILHKTFGVPLWVNVPLRLLTQVVLIPSYTILVSNLYRALTTYLTTSVVRSSSD